MTDLPEWVDGPKFVAWIEEVRPDHMAELSESHHRALYRFRQPGAKGSLDTVDRICCSLFLHLSEIPEDVWTTTPNKGRKVDAVRKAQAVEMIDAGTPASMVARHLGVAAATVRRWIRDEAA